MKSIIFFTIALTAIVVSSCYYDSQERINIDVSSGCDANSIKYTTCVQPIIDTNCKGCHTGSNASAGIKLDSYNNVQANYTVSITAIHGGTMPPAGKLSQSDITILENWKTQGFVN